jgi:hypothetical protein
VTDVGYVATFSQIYARVSCNLIVHLCGHILIQTRRLARALVRTIVIVRENTAVNTSPAKQVVRACHEQSLRGK